MSIQGKRWEHFDHQADIGVRGVGRTKNEAFEQAAIAMTAAVTDLAAVVPRDAVQIVCEADDDESLLVNWLNAVIYEMSIRRMLFREFSVHIAGGRLAAAARGEPVDAAKHQPAVEVKGATFSCIAVKQVENGQWIAQCVVDV
ncbi:MAG: archease [Kiritimatiellae bacterium]|nr:archease [Kiritimatiellia bacterium]